MSDLASILPIPSQPGGGDFIEIRVTTGCREVLTSHGLQNHLTRFVRNVRGAHSIYRLTLAEAEALADDAKSVHESVAGPEKKIVTALVEQLSKAIFKERARGFIPDPGMDSFALSNLSAAISGSPALFKIGDMALSIYGGGVRIIEGLSVHRVRSEQGPYFDNKGLFDYMWGYIGARVSDGKQFVYRVDQLLETSGELKYLKVVTIDGKRVDVPSSLDTGAKG